MAFKAGHGPQCFESGGKKKGKAPTKGKRPAPKKSAPDPWRRAMENAGKTGA